MMKTQGRPCWFELGTSDVDAARAFYGTVLGWQIGDSVMDGFDYRLARAGDEMVAGLMPLTAAPPGTPPNWMVYFATDDCDATAAAVRAAGGTVVKGPDDIPGTGRFAVATDPQGAHFGLLQPDMSRMSPEEVARAATTGAFDQSKQGHGNWLELMSGDPARGFDFYAGLFGWTKGDAMPMGAAGIYQIFAHDGSDIGGMMGVGNAPGPMWLPYFGANGVDAAIERINSAGGQVHRGPTEVPGGAFIAVASDPQGAAFAIVGPKDAS